MSSETRQKLIEEVSRAVRAQQNAVDEFDEAACKVLGINRTDARCMDILDRTGQMTAGQLATESGLSSGAVTALLDRMERAGYVRRTHDTVDRRRVLVEMTDEAREAAWQIWGPIAEEAVAGFAAYSDDELRIILNFISGGREFLASHIARVKAMPPRRA